jgi:diaphanous 1
MSSALENELRSLLFYYGENPDSPDAPKPEDFFGLIASFSSSLQVRINVLMVAMS